MNRINTYLITYDLIKPGQNYADLIKEIKQLDPSDWIKPCESTWIINSNLEVKTIIDTLSAIDATDKILILSISAPWWSEGLSRDVLDAIHRKIS